MRNANHTCLGRRDISKLDLNRRCCDPLRLCATTWYWEKSQTCVGDGISARRRFYICIQILVVALSAIFSLFTCFTLSSVLGCRAVIQLTNISSVYFLFVCFLLLKNKIHYLALWTHVSAPELQSRFHNKTLTGKFFLTILFLLIPYIYKQCVPNNLDDRKYSLGLIFVPHCPGNAAALMHFFFCFLKDIGTLFILAKITVASHWLF